MNIDEIKELIHVVRETGIMELEVKRGEESVRIRSGSSSGGQEIVLPTAVPVPVVPAQSVLGNAPAQPVQTAPPPPAAAPAKEKEEEQNLFLVKSPIVGTYYDAPAPGAPPFVKVGDTVAPRQVLCIIESMKLMNEIEAEIGGTVITKHVENGRPVEYGEALFTIRPA